MKNDLGENNTYAVIRTGAKQYLVREGSVISVEKLAGEVEDKIVFADVLLRSQNGSLKVGTPTVKNAKVEGKIVSQRRDAKKIGFRYKNKTRSGVRRGHRQYLTDVEIVAVK